MIIGKRQLPDYEVYDLIVIAELVSDPTSADVGLASLAPGSLKGG